MIMMTLAIPPMVDSTKVNILCNTIHKDSKLICFYVNYQEICLVTRQSTYSNFGRFFSYILKMTGHKAKLEWRWSLVLYTLVKIQKKITQGFTFFCTACTYLYVDYLYACSVLVVQENYVKQARVSNTSTTTTKTPQRQNEIGEMLNNQPITNNRRQTAMKRKKQRRWKRCFRKIWI